MSKFARWFPRFWQSKLSTFGVVMTTLSGLILIGAIAADFAAAGLNVYSTAFLFMVMPVFFIMGLVLIPIGRKPIPTAPSSRSGRSRASGGRSSWSGSRPCSTS